jgi:hypothetical protein
LSEFEKVDTRKWIEFYWSTRKYIFLARMWLYSQIFAWHYKLGSDFTFATPGIEVKFACEAAEKVGAKLHFLGNELNARTWTRMYHETRMNFLHYWYKKAQYSDTEWNYEIAA